MGKTAQLSMAADQASADSAAIPTNDNLLEAIQAGNQHAFAELVRYYTTPLLNFVWRITGNRSLAEDITQETLLQLWQNAGLLNSDLHVQRWLYRIAYHRTIDQLRRYRRHNWQNLENFTEILVNDDNVADSATTRQSANRLLAIIATLSNQERALLQLCCFDDLPQQAIAHILQISARAVESRLYRIREKLRRLFYDHHEDIHKT